MERISPERALADYLALGSTRSIEQLNRHYRKNESNESIRYPSIQSLRNWCVKFKWVAAATTHDAQVTKRLVQRTQTAVVAAEFDRVAALVKVAQRCLDAAGQIDIDTAKANASDIKALTSTAIEAIKTVEVLTGGVSDRTARVSGIADEARELLQRLEDQKRAKTRTIDITADVVVEERSSAADDRQD